MKLRRGRKLKKKRLAGLYVPVKAERIYDRRARSWMVRMVDVYDNQCGDAYFTGVKSDAMFCELDFQKQIKNGTAGEGYNREWTR